MIFESYCTKLGGKIDGIASVLFVLAYVLMIIVGLPALLIKVFIMGN